MKFLILSALLVTSAQAEWGSGMNVLPDESVAPTHSNSSGSGLSTFSSDESTAELEENIDPGANYDPYLGPGLDPAEVNTSPNPTPKDGEYVRGSVIESGPFDPIHEQGEVFDEKKEAEEEDPEIRRRSKEIVP